MNTANFDQSTSQRPGEIRTCLGKILIEAKTGKLITDLIAVNTASKGIVRLYHTILEDCAEMKKI
jgi:hypothetical protein